METSKSKKPNIYRQHWTAIRARTLSDTKSFLRDQAVPEIVGSATSTVATMIYAKFGGDATWLAAGVAGLIVGVIVFVLMVFFRYMLCLITSPAKIHFEQTVQIAEFKITTPQWEPLRRELTEVAPAEINAISRMLNEITSHGPLPRVTAHWQEDLDTGFESWFLDGNPEELRKDIELLCWQAGQMLLESPGHIPQGQAANALDGWLFFLKALNEVKISRGIIIKPSANGKEKRLRVGTIPNLARASSRACRVMASNLLSTLS